MIPYGSTFRCSGCQVGFAACPAGNGCPNSCGGSLVAQLYVFNGRPDEEYEQLAEDLEEAEQEAKDEKSRAEELQGEVTELTKENGSLSDQIWNLEQDLKASHAQIARLEKLLELNPYA